MGPRSVREVSHHVLHSVPREASRGPKFTINLRDSRGPSETRREAPRGTQDAPNSRSRSGVYQNGRGGGMRTLALGPSVELLVGYDPCEEAVDIRGGT